MKKLISKIKNYFHHNTVFIHDKFYDYMTDNNDLYDPMTIVEITYSKFRGIINIKFSNKKRESYLSDIKRFYTICKIDEFGGLNEYKKYSIYDKLKFNN